MAVFIPVECPKCGDRKSIVKFGQTSNDKQRFQCQSELCDINTFIINHERKGWLPETKVKIIEMTLNGSGIRDISRVLGICTETVSSEIKKKEGTLQSVNYKVLEQYKHSTPTIKRWLWHAIDHETGVVLAYVLGKHTDEVLLKLKELLKPFGIRRYYTDSCGGYKRHIPSDNLTIGKRNTQKIERKHLTLRTRIKRLARKTICFSKSVRMHDIVIGMFINRYEFGLQI